VQYNLDYLQTALKNERLGNLLNRDQQELQNSDSAKNVKFSQERAYQYKTGVRPS
jgi:hypothetical protein